MDARRRKEIPCLVWPQHQVRVVAMDPEERQREGPSTGPLLLVVIQVGDTARSRQRGIGQEQVGRARLQLFLGEDTEDGVAPSAGPDLECRREGAGVVTVPTWGALEVVSVGDSEEETCPPSGTSNSTGPELSRPVPTKKICPRRGSLVAVFVGGLRVGTLRPRKTPARNTDLFDCTPEMPPEPLRAVPKSLRPAGPL
jgi:hypothetical protein